MEETSELSPPIWVGPEWGRGILGDSRLLLVSLKEPLDPASIPRVGRTFDATLTPKYIDGTMRHQTFTDVARLVLGGPVERDACENFWRATAFANLPGPSGGTRAHPEMTEADLKSAARRVSDLIDEHAPTAFILFDESLATVLCSHEPASALLKKRTSDWIALPHPGAPGFAFREHTDAVSRLLGVKLERSPA